MNETESGEENGGRIPLRQQIQEVDRELALRRSVYPNLVFNRKMRQGEADLHTARMQAVMKTLLWLQENEAEIRNLMRPKGDSDA